MKINYPYKITISNKAEAVDAILHMCDNCENFHICTGAMADKCNTVKDSIKIAFEGESIQQ